MCSLTTTSVSHRKEEMFHGSRSSPSPEFQQRRQPKSQVSSPSRRKFIGKIGAQPLQRADCRVAIGVPPTKAEAATVRLPNGAALSESRRPRSRYGALADANEGKHRSRYPRTRLTAMRRFTLTSPALTPRTSSQDSYGKVNIAAYTSLKTGVHHQQSHHSRT